MNLQLKFQLLFNSITCSILLLLIVSSCYSQNILVVDHPNKTKRLRFRQGNTINLIHDAGAIIYGEILSISDSSLSINSAIIPVSKIEGIVITRQLPGTFSKFFLGAGTGYFILDVFNAGVNGDKPLISQPTLLASGILIGTGLLLDTFSKRKYLLKSKYRFRILNTSP